MSSPLSSLSFAFNQLQTNYREIWIRTFKPNLRVHLRMHASPLAPSWRMHAPPRTSSHTEGYESTPHFLLLAALF